MEVNYITLYGITANVIIFLYDVFKVFCGEDSFSIPTTTINSHIATLTVPIVVTVPAPYSVPTNETMYRINPKIAHVYLSSLRLGHIFGSKVVIVCYLALHIKSLET